MFLFVLRSHPWVIIPQWTVENKEHDLTQRVCYTMNGEAFDAHIVVPCEEGEIHSDLILKRVK